ncbi:MAG: trypsin-like peptidase domain-containing protein [Propionicimonas sp.]|uniref:S1C family serine protease n=1 Tax=Propionicimonas sp. TaxID=1955623 RepID=UPI002B1EDBAD|nr:trypsin-like peptidase domain-containing protein [Propionicimonas sp.]MEA4942952.1 trypsin-like peptidase domain-containing protein [Propionicimonas sp.]
MPEPPAATAGALGPRPAWPALIGIAVAIALVAGGLGALAGLRLAPASGSCDTQALAARALPAVVTVFVDGPSGGGSGSGSIITPDGLIVTNDHVIADAVPSGSIQVLLNNGEQVPATLVGTDEMTDLAVLKIDHGTLPTLTIAPEEPLQVGQPIVALGAPLGLSGTVTAGIVSALNRSIPVPKASGGTTVLTGAVQTDAAINPGNSGGPLVTCTGLQIGVNTAISTVPNADGVGGGGSVGIGWAVPASTTRHIVDQLVANGRATHPWIGADTAEVSPQAAAAFGTSAGLFVQAVTADGPAAQAGLVAGDIITTIRGEAATSVSLAWVLVTADVGAEVPVSYVRDGNRQDATITLAEQP